MIFKNIGYTIIILWEKMFLGKDFNPKQQAQGSSLNPGEKLFLERTYSASYLASLGRISLFSWK